MSGDVRPLRVLILGPSPRARGGQAIQAQRLLEHFSRVPALAPQFQSIAPSFPGPLRWLQRVKYLRTVVTECAYLGALLLRLPRTDVVHVFSASYFSFLLAATPPILLGRLFGKRVVVNYRSGEADDHLARWGWHAKPILRLAHAIVTPSGYLVEVFARHGLVAESVENFVDLEAIPFRPREHPGPQFLANRNFYPLYNVACVIRAFGHIQQEEPTATLTLAGDGPERPALESLVRELGLRGVTFLGEVTPAEMARQYDEGEVYLNASTIDNMPNSILEAFAAGMPVVSTAAGGIPYVVKTEQDGLLVPIDDAAALARAALRVLHEPNLAARLTAAGRARVLERYSWPAVRERWTELYRRLAPGSR